jgi:hypothetical protein
MEKVIHKFLDGYFQDEFVIVKLSSIENWHRVFYNNERVLSYNYVSDNSIVIVPGLDLIKMVSSFFSIENDESNVYIKSWFLLKKDFLINGKDN